MNGGPESGRAGAEAGAREPGAGAGPGPVEEVAAVSGAAGARRVEPPVSDADYAAAVGPPPRGGPPAAGHVASLGLYFGVYAALIVLTALTVFVAFVHLGVLNNVVALGIAMTKATLVVLYFMHVRWSSRLVALCVVTGVFFVLHMMGGSLQDYFTRGMLGVPGK